MRGRKNSGLGVSWMISELSASTLTNERLQPRARGDSTRRWDNRWNVS